MPRLKQQYAYFKISLAPLKLELLPENGLFWKIFYYQNKDLNGEIFERVTAGDQPSF